MVELRGDEPDAPSRIYAMTATGPTGLELSTAAIATMSAAVMTVPRHSSAATAERATTTAAELDLGAGRARGCAWCSRGRRDRSTAHPPAPPWHAPCQPDTSAARRNLVMFPTIGASGLPKSHWAAGHVTGALAARSGYWLLTVLTPPGPAPELRRGGCQAHAPRRWRREGEEQSERRRAARWRVAAVPRKRSIRSRSVAAWHSATRPHRVDHARMWIVPSAAGDASDPLSGNRSTPRARHLAWLRYDGRVQS